LPLFCDLCEREVLTRDRHHLVPRARDSQIAFLCIPCHKQVHALWTNRQLAKTYNTQEKLRDDPRMQAFIRWIRRSNKMDTTVRQSRQRRNGGGRR
jgi:hypothetical protein